jgi:hypothetical protein
MDPSYDYMKSMLSVPSHSVPLNPMSGGGNITGGVLPTIPEGNDESKNINDENTTQFKEGNENVFGIFDINKKDEPVKTQSETSNGFPEPPTNHPGENVTQFKEGEENVFGVFDMNKKVEPVKMQESIRIKEFNVGGDIYYITDVEDASKINLEDEKVKALIKDFHLDLLDEVKQKEFIFSLLKCSDLNSIVQGPVCDPLIENISYLIAKINEQYSGAIEETKSADEPSVIVGPSGEEQPKEPEERKEIGTVEKRKFKTMCNVEGDGWCLYRSLLLANHLMRVDSDDCESDAAKKFKNGNDDTIRTEIERIVQYIRTEIANGTLTGKHFTE